MLKQWQSVIFSKLIFSVFIVFPALFFQKLANVKANPSRFVSASLAVNKFKNRLVNILPCEWPSTNQYFSLTQILY